MKAGHLYVAFWISIGSQDPKASFHTLILHPPTLEFLRGHNMLEFAKVVF